MFFSKSGRRIAHNYQRVVWGGQGPYIEFSKEDLIELEVTQGQEFRYSPKYSNCKYYHLNPVGSPEIKVYHQRGCVSYADYKVGMFYISPKELDYHNDGLKLLVEMTPSPGVVTQRGKEPWEDLIS